MTDRTRTTTNSSVAPITPSDLQFSLLPLAHSSHGSITSLAVYDHAVYCGTNTTMLIKYELEVHEDEDESESTTSATGSNLRSAMSSNVSTAVPFALIRIELTSTLDLRKHHRLKPTANVPVADIQLCPALGVLFALVDGIVCAYDLRHLKFQQRITCSAIPSGSGSIDRFALFPSASTTHPSYPVSSLSSKSYSFMSIALCMGKKLYVLVRSMEEPSNASNGTDTAWNLKQELIIPEAAHCLIWIDAVHILVGFRKEYSVIDTVTGDVVDLCHIEKPLASTSSESNNSSETFIHSLPGPQSRCLLNVGNKAVLHYCEEDAHMLVDTMLFSSSPKSIGTTTSFAFTLDMNHIHVYLIPQKKGAAWRIHQNIPVSSTSRLLWSDGGELVLMAKGRQIYYLQPMLATEKQKDTLLMWDVKNNYFTSSSSNSSWTRDEALKVITTHGQALFAGRIHPFTMMIRAFEHYLAKQIQSLQSITITAPQTPLSPTNSSANQTAASSSTNGSTPTNSTTSTSPLSRAPLIDSIRQFQELVSLDMRVMWNDICNTPKPDPVPPPPVTATTLTSPAAAANAKSKSPKTGKESVPPQVQPVPTQPPTSPAVPIQLPVPAKTDFLRECMDLFNEALFRQIYSHLFPIYITISNESDEYFREICHSYTERQLTMEYFGSSILAKSPWLNPNRTTTTAVSESTDTKSPSTNDDVHSTPSISIPNSKSKDIAHLATPVDDLSQSVPNQTPPRSIRSQHHLDPPTTQNSNHWSTISASSFHPLSSNPLLKQAFESTGASLFKKPLEDGDVDESKEKEQRQQRFHSTPTSPAAVAPSTDSTNSNPSYPTPPSTLSARALFTMLLDLYEPSISLIKMLPFASSPASKVRLLTKVHYQLIKDSQKVYDPSGKKQFTMSADELLPILCFVMIQAKLTHPFAETEFMMDFLDGEAALGVDGYIVTTMQIALGQITFREGQSPTGNFSTGMTLPPSPLLAALTQNAASFLSSSPKATSASTNGNHLPSAASVAGSLSTTPSSSLIKPHRISQHFVPVPPSSAARNISGSCAASFVGSPYTGPGSISSRLEIDITSTSPAMTRVGSLTTTSLMRNESLGATPVMLTGIGSSLLAASLQTRKSQQSQQLRDSFSNPTDSPSTPSLITPIPIGSSSLIAASPPDPSSFSATPVPSVDWGVDVETGRPIVSMELRPIPSSSALSPKRPSENGSSVISPHRTVSSPTAGASSSSAAASTSNPGISITGVSTITKAQAFMATNGLTRTTNNAVANSKERTSVK